MTVWKSPVLYIGVILLTAVIGALVAPFVVDWGQYRADLELYGRKLTGREVSILGPISVRLFPWPSLTAENVHLANPPGQPNGEFASAERIAVELQAAGLFSGRIQVESIVVDKPTISIQRLADGTSNWAFSPSADMAASDLLDRVRLDGISLKDAVVSFVDGRRAAQPIVLHMPLATLSAPAIAGPWRLSADGVESGNQSFNVSLTTAQWKSGEPFRFGVTLAPGSDGGFGYRFNFDGEARDDRLTGQVRVAPAVDEKGKGNAEGELRPMAVTSKVVATFDAVALDEIQVAPVDPRDGGTLMTGSAKLALGSHISAQADLTSARLDLGDWAGAGARQLLREGGSLAVADGLLALLPEEVDAQGSLKVTSLKMGDDSLENLVLRVDMDHQAIRVREFSASLPGRSRALFDGVFFPGKQGAELAGNLAVESNDLRQLASWTFPEVRDRLEKIWTGSRGRFKMQTEVSVTADRVRLTKARYELDGVLGSGELVVNQGQRGGVDLRLDTDRIDLDSYFPGEAALTSRGLAGLAGLASMLTPGADATNLRLTVQTSELQLNGVTASDVALDVAAGANGVDLRTLEIGSVGGAHVEVSGLVLDSGRGPDGSLGIDVAADDPRELLRLLGVVPTRRGKNWSDSLGVTALKGTVSVKTVKGQPVTSLDASGTSGDFTIAASGTLAGPANPDTMDLSGTFDLKSKDSAGLAALLGLDPAGPPSSPGHLVVTAAGNTGEGFLTDFQLQAFDSRFDFNGTYGAKGNWFDASGKVSLRSTQGQALLTAMGLPAVESVQGVLVADADLALTATGELSFTDLVGRFGDTTVSGSFAVSPDGRVSGNLEAGDMALRSLLAPLFLDWSGGQFSQDTRLANRLPLGLTGELWIKPKTMIFDPAFTASDTQVGISADSSGIGLAVFGKSGNGRAASVEVKSSGDGDDRSFIGKISLPIDLARQLAQVNGLAVAAGTGSLLISFDGKGRTPAGVLAALGGTGHYEVKDLQVIDLSPQEFSAAVAKAEDAAGLAQAFAALHGGGALAGGDVMGAIAIDHGVVTFDPFTIATADAEAVVKTVADLPAAAIDISIGLTIKSAETLPAMEISYAGPPLSLTRGEDKAELSSKLGFAIMQKGVAELERLQREQLRLAAEEERMRREDEAKLQAYYAQRDEILLRKREAKVHAEMRVIAAEKLRQQIESERAANAEINKAELKQRVRELRVLRVQRRVAKLESNAADEAKTPAPPRPKPAPPPKEDQQLQVPLILVPPAGPSQ